MIYILYFYYLGYYMGMHYDYVRYLASSIQVQLTWTLNTSFVLEVKNKVSISNTESLLTKGLFLWLRLEVNIHSKMVTLIYSQRWIKDWT